MARASTLDAVKVLVNPNKSTINVTIGLELVRGDYELVSTVKGYVYLRVLVDVAQEKFRCHDELFRLEA
jgi:hypothetical protein